MKVRVGNNFLFLNNNNNRMTTAKVLIGHFSRTMGGANLLLSGLCLTFVPRFETHMLETLNVPHCLVLVQLFSISITVLC